MAACASPDHNPTHLDAFIRLPIHRVQVHGQTIAYLDTGTGDPVILIHGFGGSMWQWEHQQIPLSRHVRVITPDLIGSGLSDKPDVAYSPDQVLDFFLGFMEALHLSRATLVGNSMGAGLAMGMALSHPSRVDKLILIDGLPDHVLDNLNSPSIKRALETSAPSWLVSLGNRLFGGFMTESILKEIVHDPGLLTPAVIERSNRNRKRPGIIAPIMTVRNNLPLWESGFAKHIGQITHRTLILWGEEDRVFPLSVGEHLQRQIEGAALVRIPDAGHIPMWEQPDISNRAMVEFLKS
ncbi:putative 2-hydroxy-6-ketonona-2,4-dienedioate hydrolase [Nitrospira sp. KM1]|nr:putative 2-hydroxy-6-ketonona-2,4-dienedioate hydrolase [Nitrospira sp. KM1]